MPKVLSLFTGAGGLDIGFHQAGFEITDCVEIEGQFCETLRANHKQLGEPRIHHKDIKDFVKKRDLWPEREDVDFIIGGPPCQPFSAGGRRVGGAPGTMDAVRGTLYESYATLVENLKPKGFLFENVKGILSANEGQDWLSIQTVFEKLGYTLFHRILDTAEYGVPQHRERVILIGVEDDLGFRWPEPTHGPCGDSDYVTPLEAFSGLNFKDDGTEVSGKYSHLLPDVPEGDNYSFFTENRGHQKPVFPWRGRFSGFIYKASPDRPVKTLVANPGGWGGPFHWANRRMTVNELKRLQSIPDDFILTGSRAQKIVQIGNSVPPLMAKALARCVKVELFGASEGDLSLSEEISSDMDARKARLGAKTKNKTVKPIEIRKRIEETRRLGPQAATTAGNTQIEHLVARALDGERPENSRLGYDVVTDDCYIEVRTSEGDRGSLKLHAFQENPEEGDGYVALDIYLAKPMSLESSSFSHVRIQVDTRMDTAVIRCWDIFHSMVSEFTSYESTRQYYGHFTEPHPQFEYEFEGLDALDEWDARLQKTLTNRSMLNLDIEEEILHSIVGEDNTNNCRELLISHRIDIRMTMNNPKVPEGMFRICYPFPLPEGTKTSIPNAPSIRKSPTE